MKYTFTKNLFLKESNIFNIISLLEDISMKILDRLKNNWKSRVKNMSKNMRVESFSEKCSIQYKKKSFKSK